uniref:Uncharacterized protein n=1 Tax=Physcomitrium patens TaxID=3218 RepID=A0A2K1JTR2_PHYPA|nr:hypothetical protein PHYPA_014692 [Physcomitrium patens]
MVGVIKTFSRGIPIPHVDPHPACFGRRFLIVGSDCTQLGRPARCRFVDTYRQIDTVRKRDR